MWSSDTALGIASKLSKHAFGSLTVYDGGIFLRVCMRVELPSMTPRGERGRSKTLDHDLVAEAGHNYYEMFDL